VQQNSQVFLVSIQTSLKREGNKWIFSKFDALDVEKRSLPCALSQTASYLESNDSQFLTWFHRKTVLNRQGENHLRWRIFVLNHEILNHA